MQHFDDRAACSTGRDSAFERKGDQDGRERTVPVGPLRSVRPGRRTYCAGRHGPRVRVERGGARHLLARSFVHRALRPSLREFSPARRRTSVTPSVSKSTALLDSGSVVVVVVMMEGRYKGIVQATGKALDAQVSDEVALRRMSAQAVRSRSPEPAGSTARIAACGRPEDASATSSRPRQPAQTKVKTRTSPAASSTLNSTNPKSPSSAIRSRGSSSARPC